MAKRVKGTRPRRRGYACAGFECDSRNRRPSLLCDRCKRLESELGELVRRLLFPQPQSYTPKVFKVLAD